MIELRNLVTRGNRQLQYRYYVPAADAHGALCVGGAWSKWHDVHSVQAGSPASKMRPPLFNADGDDQ